MLNSDNYLVIILIILTIICYLGSGFFGAIIFSELWRRWRGNTETKEENYDESSFKLIKPDDTVWLKLCQAICIILGPVTLSILSILLCGIFLVYIAYAMIGIIIWIKGRL